MYDAIKICIARKEIRTGEIREAPSTATLDGKRERDQYQDRSSKKEHREDALALRADERRDKLRKAAGSCK